MSVIRRVEYPRLPEGSASPQVKAALQELTDQINAAIREIESIISQGGQST